MQAWDNSNSFYDLVLSKNNPLSVTEKNRIGGKRGLKAPRVDLSELYWFPFYENLHLAAEAVLQRDCSEDVK